MSRVETPGLEPRRELVPCRDMCGREVEVTVLYRPVMNALGEVTLQRGPVPPVMCDECAAKEQEQLAPLATSPGPASMEDWLDGLGVNTRKHGHATVDNFDSTDAPRAPGAARHFVERTLASGRHTRVEGLYLVGGDKGTGKTHLAVAIMRAVREQRPDIGMVFDPADRLIQKVQDSYGTGTTDRLIEERRQAGLYVLDDLGREKGTEDALRTLCTILDEREGAPTVITSNCLPHELGERYANEATWARLASRLGDEVYRYVRVNGRDRRLRVHEGGA